MRSSADGVRSMSSARRLDEFTRPAFAIARTRDAFVFACETRDARRASCAVERVDFSTWRASSTEGVIGESRTVDGGEDYITDESDREGDSRVGAARTERARGWGTRAIKNAERAVRGESRACAMNEMCDGYRRETGVVGNARTRRRESGGARERARDERMDARERERITKGWRRPCSRTSFVRNRRMCPP